jgi:hypothetical protein
VAEERRTAPRLEADAATGSRVTVVSRRVALRAALLNHLTLEKRKASRAPE